PRPCCDPVGGGRAGCTACGRNAVESREAKRICCARKPRSGGEIVFAGRLQPISPRRSRASARIHNETRTPWAEPLRKETCPARHPRPKACPVRFLTGARSTTQRWARTPLPHLAAPLLRRVVEAP